MDIEKVTANTKWVWTEHAEKLNPNRSRAGELVWYQYEENAPKDWLDKGLIIDAKDFKKEGQMSIFDY
ncbi:hypothetical protein ACINKY_21470 [Paenibacillus illinoisensis]|uniref:Uncharacterized protein n=1 Tax=Paenibacillus illinoisensis TaxID=59845 RepID=A0ABW8HYK2_9BACL